eukprot:1194814-Prorocentrum_minimum.AAC.1
MEGYRWQLWKAVKKAFSGCVATTTHLPIASASAVVVATTSLKEGFTKARKARRDGSRWSFDPWK